MSTTVSTIVYCLLAVKFHTFFSSTSESIKSVRDKATNTVSSFLTKMEGLYAEKYDDELSDEAVEYAYAREYIPTCFSSCSAISFRSRVQLANIIVIVPLILFAQSVKPYSTYSMSSLRPYGQRSL